MVANRPGGIGVAIHGDGSLWVIDHTRPGAAVAIRAVVGSRLRPTSAALDAWGALFSTCLRDGEELPLGRASEEAVRRWGGRVSLVIRAVGGTA